MLIKLTRNRLNSSVGQPTAYGGSKAITIMMRAQGLFHYPGLIVLVLLLVTMTACMDHHSVNSGLSTLSTTVPYSGGETACDHPFFPFRTGAYWRYEIDSYPHYERISYYTLTGSSIHWQVTGIQDGSGDTTAAVSRSLVLQPTDAGYTLFTSTHPYLVQCDASGIAPLVDSLNYSSNFDPLLPVERTLHLPAAELLQQGYSWEGSSYEIGVGGGMNSVVYHWNEAYAVTAAEPVALNGHVYDGLQITKIFTNYIEGRPYIAIGDSVNELIEGTVVFTLARGVGVVQATTTYTLLDLTEPSAKPSSPQVNEINLTEFYMP